MKETASRAWGCLFLLCPPIAQSSGRFKLAHVDVYYSARAEPEVRQFETALYSAVF